MQIMTTTYPWYYEPAQLLEILIDHFGIYNSKLTAEQLKITNCILHWAKAYPGDFNSKMIAKLENFCELVGSDFQEMVQKVLNTVGRTQPYEFGSLKQDLNIKKPAVFPTLDRNYVTFNWFQKLDSISIAEHFTWLEWKVFHQLDARDLVQHATKNTKLSPWMKLSIQHFSFMSATVRTLILIQETVEFRSQIIAKIISIGVHLRKMNNYHGLMAILNGLGHKSITRLTDTMSNVKNLNIYKDLLILKSLMHVKDDFKKYRSALTMSTLPCIPYM